MAQQGLCPVATKDPEEPTCARVVISGDFEAVTDPNEFAAAKSFLFDRHPTMQTWPDDHNFNVYKINIREIWLIDIYGGGKNVSQPSAANNTLSLSPLAAIVDVADYYAVDVTSLSVK